MLVLARESGEELVIGAETRLRVLAVSGNRVRLAIEAPPHVRVRRSEIEPREPSQSPEELVADRKI